MTLKQLEKKVEILEKAQLKIVEKLSYDIGFTQGQLDAHLGKPMSVPVNFKLPKGWKSDLKSLKIEKFGDSYYKKNCEVGIPKDLKGPHNL